MVGGVGITISTKSSALHPPEASLSETLPPNEFSETRLQCWLLTTQILKTLISRGRCRPPGHQDWIGLDFIGCVIPQFTCQSCFMFHASFVVSHLSVRMCHFLVQLCHCASHLDISHYFVSHYCVACIMWRLSFVVPQIDIWYHVLYASSHVSFLIWTLLWHLFGTWWIFAEYFCKISWRLVDQCVIPC